MVPWKTTQQYERWRQRRDFDDAVGCVECIVNCCFASCWWCYTGFGENDEGTLGLYCPCELNLRVNLRETAEYLCRAYRSGEEKNMEKQIILLTFKLKWLIWINFMLLKNSSDWIFKISELVYFSLHISVYTGLSCAPVKKKLSVALMTVHVMLNSRQYYLWMALTVDQHFHQHLQSQQRQMTYLFFSPSSH